MTKDEVLKLALEGLKWASDQIEPENNDHCLCPICKGIDAIQEALAQPEQEPVAKYTGETYRCPMVILYKDIPIGTLLYTTPPQRKPLTDEHPLMVFAKECVLGAYQETELADAAQRAIKAAHGIKE